VNDDTPLGYGRLKSENSVIKMPAGKNPSGKIDLQKSQLEKSVWKKANWKKSNRVLPSGKMGSRFFGVFIYPSGKIACCSGALRRI
jgi:hypothetical protein